MKFLRYTLLCLAASLCFGQEYQEDPSLDGTDVKGRIVWSGNAPGPVYLKANKNQETCCGKAVEACDTDSRRLVVNKDNKGVKYSVVYLADYDLSVPGKKFPKGGDEITQKACQYEPHVAMIQKGKKFTFINEDEILHNVHGYLGQDTVVNLAQPLPAKNKEKLGDAGQVELRCDAGHTWMTAWIWVVEHPYHAITDADGNFNLSNVPDGVYQLKVWHEGWEIKETLKNDKGEVTGYIFSDPVVLGPFEVIVSGGAVEGLPAEIAIDKK